MACGYKPLFVAVVSVLAATFVAGCSGAPEKRTGGELPALDFLGRKIKMWVDERYYDGMAVRVVKDGKVFYEDFSGGYTDTTVIHVASAGKWVAAATIASLVDEGVLSWDDRVKKYLPQFDGPKGDATLRQLMSHTSGYPYRQPEGCRMNDCRTLKEVVDNISTLPADTLPGTVFSYGEPGMLVAGRMAEEASGRDWGSLFRENIALPLGMSKSGFCQSGTETGSDPIPEGAFYTCLRDYTNFLGMIAGMGEFNGRRVLSEGAVRETEADQLRGAAVRRPEYVWNARQNTHDAVYGLGVWREELGGDGNAVLISSPDKAGTYAWVDRKNNTYGLALAKANEAVAVGEGFSPFYSGAVIPVIVRDAVRQSEYPAGIKTGYADISGGARLYYEERGSGEPLILLHGHSLDHRMWDTQFYEFSKEFRVIRYDMRGYGYSSVPDEAVQFTHVEDLAALMDALGADKAHIVGLSMGGFVGTDMLGWYPDRVITATLASGNRRPLPKPSIPMDEAEAARRDMEIKELKNRGVDVMKREWFNGLMLSGGSRRERMRKPLWEIIQQWGAWQPLHKEPRVIAGGDAYDRLMENKPRIPVLLLEGRSENNRYSEEPEILNHLPLGRQVVIDDAGHMINMERPEEFNRAVMDFIHNSK